MTIATLLSFIAAGEGGYNSMNQGTQGGRIVGSTHNAAAEPRTRWRVPNRPHVSMR